MHRFSAPSHPAHVHTHDMVARAMADFATYGNWSAAFAATTKRSSKRTARHLGTETT